MSENLVTSANFEQVKKMLVTFANFGGVVILLTLKKYFIIIITNC